MTDDKILPVVQGDWVAALPGHSFRIGRVRAAYWDKDEVYIDLVLFEPSSGDKIGRISPHMGGPKTFEPWIQYTGNYRRIEKPSFPMEREGYATPSKTQGFFTQHYDFHPCVAAKPERTKTLKQRRARFAVRLKSGNFDPELEKAALLRGAQELRDMARRVGAGDVANTLTGRAEELEKEAKRLGI